MHSRAFRFSPHPSNLDRHPCLCQPRVGICGAHFVQQFGAAYSRLYMGGQQRAYAGIPGQFADVDGAQVQMCIRDRFKSARKLLTAIRTTFAPRHIRFRNHTQKARRAFAQHAFWPFAALMRTIPWHNQIRKLPRKLTRRLRPDPRTPRPPADPPHRQDSSAHP